MTMDIKNNLTPTHPRTTGDDRSVAENAGVRGGGPEGGRDPGGSGDRVTLSNTANQLNDLARSASEQPAVDTQRVEQIRDSIKQGTYEINAERIADRLIAMERVR
ncbi:MAG: flagellar biosynthesis anti-sigma factor FlgM [Thioalkalivibrio sp.]|nr:MAG: flagellar biosynthesis anti-sigma factor FlgM [Thioalkalivibrio sp.]